MVAPIHPSTDTSPVPQVWQSYESSRRGCSPRQVTTRGAALYAGGFYIRERFVATSNSTCCTCRLPTIGTTSAVPFSRPIQVTPIRITISSIVHSSRLEHCSCSQSQPNELQVAFLVQVANVPKTGRGCAVLVLLLGQGGRWTLHTIYLACTGRASHRA